MTFNSAIGQIGTTGGPDLAEYIFMESTPSTSTLLSPTELAYDGTNSVPQFFLLGENLFSSVLASSTASNASTTTTLAATATAGAAEAAKDERQPFLTSSTSEVVEMIYQLILFAVGTPINVVALIKFSKSSKSNSSEMRLMRLSRQLLIAHLMVLCIYCVWRTYWLYNITWMHGNLFCKAYSFLSALPFHLWSNIVAAIAADMLYCIRLPLKSVHNGNKRVTWLIGIAWLSAIICASPMALFRGTIIIPEYEPHEQCYSLYDQFDNSVLVIFNVFHVVTTFYVPLTIIILCYLIIGLTLRTQMAERKLLGDDKRRSHNINSRFLFGTACIVCTFVLTWLPYQVMALLRVICAPDSNCEKFVTKFTWLQAILIASTCINPFLYKFGIFRSARRNVSGAHTYHSQVGACSGIDSTVAPTTSASTTGIRGGDFRHSMRSLGPTSSGAVMLINNTKTNGRPKLVSRLSAGVMVTRSGSDRDCSSKNVYRGGAADVQRRCHSTATPPSLLGIPTNNNSSNNRLHASKTMSSSSSHLFQSNDYKSDSLKKVNSDQSNSETNENSPSSNNEEEDPLISLDHEKSSQNGAASKSTKKVAKFNSFNCRRMPAKFGDQLNVMAERVDVISE